LYVTFVSSWDIWVYVVKERGVIICQIEADWSILTYR